MPLVSVIMPVYNVQNYIRASIESVLCQSFNDYELILVDDGSPDQCPQICDEYALKDKRIHVIHKENGGLSSARNTGVEAASGKYIMFLDSDDTIMPGTIEHVVSKAEEMNVDIVIFNVQITVYVDGNITAQQTTRHDNLFCNDKESLNKEILELCRTSKWNYVYDKLYRRSIICDNHVRANSYYDRVCEDTVFLLDLYPYVDSIYVMDQTYYCYNIRNNQSVVRSFVPERYEKHYGRWCKLRDLLREYAPGLDSEQYLMICYLEYIAMSYEMLFHPDCQYSGLELLRYIKNIFSASKENMAYRKKVVKCRLSNYSAGILTAAKAICMKKYFLAWMLCSISKIKRRLSYGQ